MNPEFKRYMVLTYIGNPIAQYGDTANPYVFYSKEEARKFANEEMVKDKDDVNGAMVVEIVNVDNDTPIANEPNDHDLEVRQGAEWRNLKSFIDSLPITQEQAKELEANICAYNEATLSVIRNYNDKITGILYPSA